MLWIETLRDCLILVTKTHWGKLGRKKPCKEYPRAGLKPKGSEIQLQSVAASSQSLGSSNGTVVLIHEFLPLRLASNNRGWWVHTLNFRPEAAGQFLAAENVLRPFHFANCQWPPSGVFLFDWILSTAVPQGMALVCKQRYASEAMSMSDQNDWEFAGPDDARAEIRAAVGYLLRDATGGARGDIVQEIIAIVRQVASGFAARAGQSPGRWYAGRLTGSGERTATSPI
jgi:hypothetical protein